MNAVILPPPPFGSLVISAIYTHGTIYTVNNKGFIWVLQCEEKGVFALFLEFVL